AAAQRDDVPGDALRLTGDGVLLAVQAGVPLVLAAPAGGDLVGEGALRGRAGARGRADAGDVVRALVAGEPGLAVGEARDAGAALRDDRGVVGAGAAPALQVLPPPHRAL